MNLTQFLCLLTYYTHLVISELYWVKYVHMYMYNIWNNITGNFSNDLVTGY